MSNGFEAAVRATPGLAAAFRSGFQAVRSTDLVRIACRNGRLLTGSVGVDQVLENSRPNDNRWDYGIGVKNGSEYVVWIEVHPASSGHVQDVIAKLKWLHDWLRTEAPALEQLRPRFFVWVASGSVSLPASSRQRRLVAQAGILFAGGRVEVDHL